MPVSGVLVDTSVWIQHFRQKNPQLVQLLALDAVCMHPLVLLELACGTPPAPRERTLADLALLRPAVEATHTEVLVFIDRHHLYNKGCGAVDIALLASVRMMPGARLWTLDKSLIELSDQLGVGWATRLSA